MKRDFIFFDESSYLDKKTMKELSKIEIPHWSGGIDFGFEKDYLCEYKPKKEKKMGKITRSEAKQLIQEALEDFAQELGLDYSTVREELDGGQINSKFLPDNNITDEVTKDVKEVRERTYLDAWFSHPGSKRREATVLGKVNALANHLGVTFDVQPERVTAEKVVARKTTTKTATKAKAVKKGKK